MIIKQMQYGNYIINRLGIGWAVKLIYAKNDENAIMSLLPHFIVPFDEAAKTNAELIKACIDFNFHTDKQKDKKSDGENDIDKIVAGIVNKLAYAYGWTIDYIMSNVDFFQAQELIELINESDKNFAILSAVAYHNPQKLSELGSHAEKTWNIFDYVHSRRGGVDG